MGENYYHVVSRVVDRRFVFGDVEKRYFRRLLEGLLGFSGVRCLTFCLMDNHFHLLLAVSDDEGERFRREASAGEVMGRLRHIYPEREMKHIRETHRRLSGLGDGSAGRDYLGRFVVRMYDLSVLLRELKGRFSRWYNRRAKREGTLWEGRFRSVLTEGASPVLQVVAAYIDLNPVRAGIVREPERYRWSGYGEAVRGSLMARRGLAIVLGEDGSEVGGGPVRWRDLQARYRERMIEEEEGGGGRRGRFHHDEGTVSEVVRRRGKLTVAQALRCQVLYFSRGFAIGGKEFLEKVFREHRDQFGPRRESGARPMRWVEWGGLMAMRDLGGGAVSFSDDDEA